MIRSVAIGCLLFIVSCGGGSGAVPAAPTGGAPLLLAAGLVQLTPALFDDWSGGVDLSRLGLGAISQVYDLTTPAGTPFTFDILSRAGGNTGPVRVSVAHAKDGGLLPPGGPETLAAAGLVPSASGAASRTPWLDSNGDGFARVTMRGAIDSEQILAIETSSEGETTTALVRVRIGLPSEINLPPVIGGDYPGVLATLDVYSSDSWAFGQPVVAVSGDRATIAAYEGDQTDPWSGIRYEMRMQVDLLTGAVTGGGSHDPSPDMGNWRDHEVAALFNVLAIVTGGGPRASLKISFDRGATFGQTLSFGSLGIQPDSVRLVQIAMALDYSMAVLYWHGSDLLLVEGSVSAFDGTGSPTRYAFGAPRLVHRAAGDVSPLLMGATYSTGGDLVIGYAFSSVTSLPDFTWESLTQFRCATRLFGAPAFEDVLVEEDRLIGRDPSVSVLGSGPTMRIFYAYEARDGVRLRTSSDAGATFSAPESVGGPGGYAPSVFARDQGGQTRVDLLYIGEGEFGSELHLRHWDDFGTTPPTDHRLTRATSENLGGGGGGGVGPGFAPVPPGGGFKMTSLAWFGYDATLDGDDVVVVTDEQTWDGYFFALGAPDVVFTAEGGAPAAADFTAADPPPLAPGLTLPLPPPNPLHIHQLRFHRLD